MLKYVQESVLKFGGFMKKVKDNILERRQPNSETREEFLIVVEYLLNEAYDEAHATSQKKIVEYAESKYGAYVRRDRINQILIHLVQLSNKYPDKIPFKIHAKKINKIYKFYVDERMFSDKEILDIVSSIINDRTKSNPKAEALVEKLLNIATNEHKKKELSKSIKRINRKHGRLTNVEIDQLELYQEAMLNKYRLWFKFKSYFDVDFSRHYISQKRKNQEDGLSGFIYRIIERDNGTLLVLYLDDEKNAAVAKVEDVQLLRKPMDIGEWADDINFELKDRHYSSIDEWIDLHYSGLDGLTREVTIKTTIIDPKSFQKFQQKFEEYWQIPMNYEIKKRETYRIDINENGEEVEIPILVDDAYISFTCNMPSFRHWYMDYDVFSKVVIIDPPSLNERFMASLAERLMRRITKYGGKYNYTFTRTLKPEYEQEMKEREQRRKEYLERRKKVEENA